MIFMDIYAAGSIIYRNFNTHKADGTPITLAGTPTARVYKDDGTTEDDSGITLTVDFDSKTGLHNVKIDTSQDATFYATGHDYSVVLSAGTVDGVSVVGYEIFKFRLGEIPVDVVKISGDATAADNCEADYDGTGYAGGTIVKKADATKILGSALSETSAGYLAAGFKKLLDVASPVFTLASINQTGDSYARLGSPAGASIAADLVAIDNFVDDIESRLTATRAGYLDILADLADSGRLDLLIDSILADTNELQTDLVNGGRLDLLIDAINAKTSLLTFVNGHHVESEVQDKTGFSLSTAGILAIWHQAESAIVTASTIGLRIKTNLDAAITTRSSHAAADVWAVGTRSLTTFGTLIADIWASATRSLTDKAGFSLHADYDAAKSAAPAGAKMDIVDAPNATGLAAIADAFLKRDWTSVTGEATRSVLNALRPLLNKWTSASGAGGYVVKKEDDSTTAWTGTLTVDENGNISGMDHD